MPRTFRGLFLLGILALLCAAPSASADTALSPRQATSISASGGAVVWDEPRPGSEWILYSRRNRRTSRVDVPASEQPFNADLGPRRGGGVVAVYERCPNSDYDCAIYTYDFRRGQERRERRIHRRGDGCEEDQPAYWRGTIAFLRTGGRRCRTGVFVRGRGRRARARRVSSLRPDAIDLRRRTIIWHDDDNDCGRGGDDPIFCGGQIVNSSVGTVSFSGRRRTLTSARHHPGTPDAREVRHVGLDGRFAYFIEVQGDQYGQVSLLITRLVRQPLSGGGLRERRVLSLSQQARPRSAAVAGRNFVYVSDLRPYQPFRVDVFPF